MPHGLIRYGRTDWTLRDRILALALQMYEDGLCPGCGLPANRAHDPLMEGYYVPNVVTCQACATREREGAEKHAKGTLIGVRDESYAEGYEPRRGTHG